MEENQYEIAKQSIVSSNVRGTSVCNLTMQRAVYGRLGRELIELIKIEKQQNLDSVLACAVCRADGIGFSTNNSFLRSLAADDELCDQQWKENGKKDHNAVINRRARSCTAVKDLKSCEEQVKQRGLKLLKSCAEKGDSYAVLNLGLLCESGMNGVVKDETRARELYKRCKENGLSNVSLMTFPIERNKERLKPKYPEWNSLLYRIYFNTTPPILDLSGFLKIET